MTIHELLHLTYFRGGNLELARKALRIQAFSLGWRRRIEERLTKLEEAAG
ncbi:MAG: hypothetical protein HY320_04245 [Armatimonadetes bacterium]|nr:hypothetical protein [Armatimonadota bacterium]